jgi:D-beta-D-heptose 7-phosphate kinase/D-beta-D-heptose 1-phosphate adenosyltransferase
VSVDPRRLLELVEAFPRSPVAVVGDFYLDEYVHGSTMGISPEMPVLRIVDEGTQHVSGAAGNVAANFAALGAPVTAFGVVGVDPNGDRLLAELREQGVAVSDLVRDPARVTGTFTRIVARVAGGGDHHLLRLDRDNPRPPSAATLDDLATRVAARLGDLRALYLADYDETDGRGGLLSPAFVARVVREARARGVLVAGSSRRHVAELAGVDHLFCNLSEARGLGLPSEDRLEAWAAGARRQYGLQCLCVTLGDAGLLCSTAEEVFRVSALPTVAVDACGAGDSLAAAFVLAALAGASPREAAAIGTRAASIVVQKPGTVPVAARELGRPLDPGAAGGSKLRTREELIELLGAVRGSRKIVFTNGCFDLFHAGHIALLRAARSCGDLLVVGINSDRSTRANKGEGRPVLPEEDRIQILSALECVDHVVVFDELTPIRLIRDVAPDVLVKGGDYTVDEVIGKDLVEAAGGRVVVIPYESKWTTKSLIRSVKAASDGTRTP